MKKILVLSGGGALGIMQLRALSEIEGRTGKKISDIYDLIVGTSVGAINGSILASGVPATKFLSIFYNGIDKVFKRKWYAIPFVSPLYSRDNFKKMFIDTIGTPDLKMSDLSTNFVCTSVNRVNKKTEYFKSWKSNENVLDCVLRSFAAPYYFGHLVDKENKAVWFDGGVGTANLPIDIAYTEALKMNWFNDGISITCVTCGSVNLDPINENDKTKRFNKLKKQLTPFQVMDFVSAEDGGIARIQSMDEKKYRYKIISSYQNMIFRLVDIEIDEQYNKLDAVEFKDKYIEYGTEMANIINKNEWNW